VTDISHQGWRLWLDRDATWQNDTLYLPEDVNLAKLPTNPPSGGWSSLVQSAGIPITLPTTVEEHFWGKIGKRPYNKFEAQRGPDTSFQNGNYLGVSWWWRTIEVPHFKSGQHLLVSFRGARLRAEVYCNHKLCGYTILGELPFQADITDAVGHGNTAQLAVRITNPGGHFDWLDFGSARLNWGQYTMPPSRGFGGLDENIRLEVRDNVSVSDLAAIDEPNLHRVRLVADVKSLGRAYRGPVKFEIIGNGSKPWTGTTLISLPAGGRKTVSLEASVPGAKPWDLQHPNLYRATAQVGGSPTSAKSVDFGFRFFTAKDIGGQDAKLTLNGKRIVLLSAISWGFWGRNGLWPDHEMAAREVANAKTLGLNCLQFHRNIGKPEVLDLQDREGLLRCEEPGGGKFVLGTRYSKGPFGPDGKFPEGDDNDTFDAKRGYTEPDSVDTSGKGPDGDGQAFWERYEEAKILAMVKRDRSHPSLIEYTIQNEASDLDLRNPRIYRILREMHALDPSRVITFFSGGDPRIAQVRMMPYDDTIYYGSKTLPYAGWKDVHTCGGPCTYLDDLYKNPNDFQQHWGDDSKSQICVWGEALGAATPDDYDHLVHSFDADHPNGYELDDDRQVLAGYHNFLDKYGFRAAFPTDSSLFQAIGYRTYYFWKRIIEQSRFDNTLDSLVVSGWESTSIDNHSGLVDNHRFFKGDPKVIAEATRPEVLVIQPRRVIVSKGDTCTVDVFLINQTGRIGDQTLSLTAKDPDGHVAFTVERNVSVIGGDTYGQLLTQEIEIPADQAGMLSIEARLTPNGSPGSALRGTDQIEVVDVSGSPIMNRVAVWENGDEVAKALQDCFGVHGISLDRADDSDPLDAIVLAPKAKGQDRNSSPQIPSDVVQKALRRVRDEGVRLVLWPDDNFRAESFVRELVKAGAITSSGDVGNLGAPWFGSWFFVRKHWLLDGLPADCAMDWRYGVSAFGGPAWLKDTPGGSGTDGFLMDARGMDVAVGYGADHNTKVGVSGCVIPYGKGEVVFYCLPQLVRSLQPGDFAISMPVCRRMLGNALRKHG
jgi:hypothetical protein